MLSFFLRKMGYDIPEGPIVFVDSCRMSDLPLYSNDIENKIGKIETGSIKQNQIKDIVCEDS